jgi:predicted site-specific integrase-resolvase
MSQISGCKSGGGFAMEIGYARVSTREQDLGAQVAELNRERR